MCRNCRSLLQSAMDFPQHGLELGIEKTLGIHPLGLGQDLKDEIEIVQQRVNPAFALARTTPELRLKGSVPGEDTERFPEIGKREAELADQRQCGGHRRHDPVRPVKSFEHLQPRFTVQRFI